MTKNGEFTPTEQRILAKLSDGEVHTNQELRACVDEFCSAKNLRSHLTILRKKLQPNGEDIVCVLLFKRKLGYRHVRMLNRTDLSVPDGVIRIR